MIKYDGAEKRMLTPELAAEFATMQGTVCERQIKDRRLKFLRHKLEDGLFHSPRWATAQLAGKTYRVNGQHSSTMLAECNGDFPDGLAVIIDRFHCDSDDDLSELFSQFDGQECTRTKAEVVNAHASIHDELKEIDRTNLGIAISGISMAMSSAKDKSRQSSTDAAKLVHSYREFIIWVHPLLKKHRNLRRAAFMCAVFLTWQVDSESSARFWELVTTESHPEPNHPTRVLSRFILGLPRRGEKRASMMFTDRAIAAKCIHAWNAWRKNKPTDLKYHADAPFPEPI